MLKHAKPSNFNIPCWGKVYINESQCRYHKLLWSKYKKLWGDEWTGIFDVSKGQIKLRVEEGGEIT